MYKNYPSTSKEIVDLCFNLGCNAIELNVASIEEVKSLEKNMNKIKNSLAKFEYVSLHSPAIKFIYLNDTETRKTLNILQNLLYQTKQLDIIQSIPDKNLPIIIESYCVAIEDMKSEYAYIIQNL